MAADLTLIEDLDRNILTLCTHIDAATYELLVLIREFDERVAHALNTLPGISGAFASGELSYSKVRVLTRVASRANEDELLVFALRATAGHVAKRSLRVRRDPHRHTMTITVELPLDSGELIEKALDKARDDEVLAL